MTDKGIVTVPENNVSDQVVNSPMAAYQMLLNQGGSLENIEKMMELQARWEQIEAKKAYVQAMAAFKANPPKINKDKHVDFNTQKGRTSYYHASLGNVTSKINAAMAEHGLSAGWKIDQSGNGITVTCTITHKLGYSESTSLTAGAETSGTKNSIQAIGSTISYLSRYTLLSLTGLATHDQDDDGGAATIQAITEKQISQIVDMINETNTDEAAFLKWLKVGAVNQIPCNLFNKAMTALKSKVQS